MTSVGKVVLVVAAACALSAPTPVEGQAVGTGVLAQGYSFEDATNAGLASFRLVTFPFAASVPIGSRLAVTVTGAYAEGSASSPLGQEASLTGYTDTDLSVTFAVDREWLVVGFDATLATGKATLTTAESLVAGVVAAELLPFSINSWGSGGGMGGHVSVVTQAGPWGIGLAGGYRIANEFEPLPDQPIQYKPGDQIHARLAIDRDVATSSTLSFLLGFQRYSDDSLLDTNLFRPGSRIHGLVSLAFPLTLRSSAVLYGSASHRSGGSLLLSESVLAGASDAPSQQLFTLGSRTRAPLWRGGTLQPGAEISVFRTGDGESQGWIASAGATLDVRLAGNSSGTRLLLSPTARARVGNVVVQEGSEASFTGWDAGLTLSVEGWR